MMKAFSSLVMLGIAILILPFIIYYHLKNDPISVNYSVLYGSLLLMGWISALILGQTFKTLPFIVWVKHYGHLTGKVKTPLPSDLVKNRFLKVQAAGFMVFCTTFFPGVFLSSGILIYTGISALLLTAAMYVTNVVAVLFHKTKTL
jgi:FtsH-binding integral membrane protein